MQDFIPEHLTADNIRELAEKVGQQADINSFNAYLNWVGSHAASKAVADAVNAMLAAKSAPKQTLGVDIPTGGKGV